MKKLAFMLALLCGGDMVAQTSLVPSIYQHILSVQQPVFVFPKTSFAEKDNSAFSANNFSEIDLAAIRFNSSDLALFCRLEWKIEKAARFPIKFRLGEVQYVEQMEGK